MVKLEPRMPLTYYSSSPGGMSISDSDVDGTVNTDYLLSSTMRLDDNPFHVLGKLLSYVNFL